MGERKNPRNPCNPYNPRFKHYPEYKESGVEWIGEIPAHWKIKKIKHIATLVSEKSTPETGTIKISPENVESKTGKVLDFYSSYDSSGVKFQVGDVLFNKIRVYLNKVVFAEYDGYSLGEMIVMRPSLQGMGRYLFYFMLSSRFIEYCDSISYGAKMPRTAVDDILNAQIPITSDKEQREIANFLDQKTGKIDELIRIKERQIELLREQRTALINQVATKGLDPNVEMKPSGIEWIGEIPKHWVAKKLRYFCSMKSGNGFSHDLQGRTGLEIPFFKVSDTNTPENKVEMFYAQNTVSSQDVSDFKFIFHKPNSIVFPKVGAALLLNKRNVLAQKSCIDNNMMSLYSNQSNHKFLYYAMLNVDFKRHYREGGAVPSINESEVGNIAIAYPSLSEQCQIANFLDRKTEQIDELITAEQRKIELLKEYRQSLISEAVTGKIDVRNEV